MVSLATFYPCFCVVLILLAYLTGENIVNKIRVHNKEVTKKWHLSRELSAGTLPLPRQLFFFTDGSDEVDRLSQFSGWTPRIYNETTGRGYMKDHCRTALTAYDRIAPIAGKADIFRLCALLTEGGLYLDDDLTPVQPFDSFAIADSYGLLLVEDDSATNYWGARETNDLAVWQAMIGAAWPGHPFFVCALRNVVSNVIKHRPGNSLLGITGPQALRTCSRNYMFRYQILNSWPHAIARNRTHVVMLHKAFPSREGRGRHYSEFDSKDMMKEE